MATIQDKKNYILSGHRFLGSVVTIQSFKINDLMAKCFPTIITDSVLCGFCKTTQCTTIFSFSDDDNDFVTFVVHSRVAIAVITVTSGLDTQTRLMGHFPLY